MVCETSRSLSNSTEWCSIGFAKDFDSEALSDASNEGQHSASISLRLLWSTDLCVPSFSITSLVQEFSIIPSKLWTAASPWYELFSDSDSAKLSSESPPLL